jgi:hypothetical protein
MTRYLPARHCIWLATAALVLAGASCWFAYTAWAPVGFVPAVLFLLASGILFYLAARPGIEIHEGYLAIGRRIVPWMDIRRLDRVDWMPWMPPLVIRLTLYDDSRLLLMYPGDLDSCNSLLRHLRRLSRDALIDGIPYRQYWGEVLAPAGERRQPKSNASINVSKPSAISTKRTPRTRNSSWGADARFV